MDLRGLTTQLGYKMSLFSLLKYNDLFNCTQTSREKVSG